MEEEIEAQVRHRHQAGRPLRSRSPQPLPHPQVEHGLVLDGEVRHVPQVPVGTDARFFPPTFSFVVAYFAGGHARTSIFVAPTADKAPTTCIWFGFRRQPTEDLVGISRCPSRHGLTSARRSGTASCQFCTSRQLTSEKLVSSSRRLRRQISILEAGASPPLLAM